MPPELRDVWKILNLNLLLKEKQSNVLENDFYNYNFGGHYKKRASLFTTEITCQKNCIVTKSIMDI